MTRRLILAAIIVLGTLAWILLRSFEPVDAGAGAEGSHRKANQSAEAAAASQPTEAGTRASRRILEATAPAGLESGATESAEEEAGSDELRVLRGTVFDGDLEPIAGAFVVSTAEGEPARSAEDGSFELPIRGRFSVRNGRAVVAWRKGYAPDRTYVRPGQAARLQLQPEEAVEIQVLDRETRAPLPGAETELVVRGSAPEDQGFVQQRLAIAIPESRARTDAEGKVRAPKGSGLSLSARADGYIPSSANLEYARAVRLRRAAPLRFRLVDRSGRPVAGARCSFYYQNARAESDEEGWVDVPVSGQGSAYHFQILAGERKWYFLTEEWLPPPTNGGEVLFGHHPRAGRVRLPEGAAPQDYEIATSSADEDGDPMPRPFGHAAALDWVRLEADGGFRIESGWQGHRTAVHLRRVLDKALVHSEVLAGEGPYEIFPEAVYRVTVDLRVHPPERLEGAEVVLVRQGFCMENDEIRPELRDGTFEVDLLNGEYLVNLRLAGTVAERALGGFEVADQPLELTLELGSLRDLAGRILAGGEPVFPCRLWFQVPEDPARPDRGTRFWAESRTDESGAYVLRDAPGKELVLRMQPDDPWLTSSYTREWSVPDEAGRFDVGLPVAVLELSAGRLEGVEADEFSVQRRELAEEGGDRMRSSWNERLELPKLENGTASVRMTPCELELTLRRPGFLPSVNLVRLRAGEVRQLQLGVVAAGELSVRLRGFERHFRGQVQAEPLEVPAPNSEHTVLSGYGGYSWEPGQIERNRKLLPGVWRVRIEAPLTHSRDDVIETLGIEGEIWETEARVEAGRATVVWIELDEAGMATLTSEILER